MRKSILCLIISLSVRTVSAQWTITPYVGINSTQVEYIAYLKGGNYGLVGIDIEKLFKFRKYSMFNISAVSGASYLANGFSRDISYNSFNIVSSLASTELKTKYLQVPLTMRLNWQPFALMEGWKIFCGGGITYNYLMKSELSEKETVITQSTAVLLAPPLTVNYEDSGEITEYGPKNSLFLRLELGNKFKHFHFAYRYNLSLTDMHHHGFESDWNVPEDRSEYMSPYDWNGKRTEKYHEFVVGWVFN